MESSLQAHTPHKAVDIAGFEQEYLQVSRDGAYSAATTAGCNTRRYHGLLVAPHPHADDDPHVLLSSLEETVSIDDRTWQLDTHRYPSLYYPEGYKLIKSFKASPLPLWTFKAGKTEIRKSLAMTEHNVLLLKYEFRGPQRIAKLRIKPLLAFRNAHWLRKASTQVSHEVVSLHDGVKLQPFDDYGPLYLHFSEQAAFTPEPCWYYQVEYQEEAKRGYDCHEDLYCPGTFEITLVHGEQLVIAVGQQECGRLACKRMFAHVSAELPVRHTFEEHLQHAASQFLLHDHKVPYIKAGYYWFGRWGRDTCISLPGLTLLQGNLAAFKEIVDGLLVDLKDGLVPNCGHGKNAAYNSADASLWLIWALQQYAMIYNAIEDVWEIYGAALHQILHHYKLGTSFGIGMTEDGLLQAGQDGYALTWMDAVVDGSPVTPRMGKAVEINALWYNAICFCLEAARQYGDENFTEIWSAFPERICYAFVKTFWSEEKKYLADCVGTDGADWSVRPNQLFAISLPFSPLPETIGKAVFNKIRDELFTARGLRTLSPCDNRYQGHYRGTQAERDRAYHQGTAWPWLLASYAEAYLRFYQQKALPIVKTMYADMEHAMYERCLYFLSEVHDGEFPHSPGGAVAQAWSVAETIRLKYILIQAEDHLKAGRKVPVSSLPHPVPYQLYPLTRNG